MMFGRKFSLRVYVIILGGSSLDHVFVSREGLVKLAVQRYSEGSSSAAAPAHTTNSGWGRSFRAKRPQEDLSDEGIEDLSLEDLEAYFKERGWSYSYLWQHIREAVAVSMKALKPKWGRVGDLSTDRLKRIRTPKILGFDFLIDNNRRPWLIEV
uniref:Tubulin--tyrosine ligase-like protein 5 n=1 Tax=Octactis speculum TaxID=3111310 RepID=A0A7S2AZQ2_9STRA